MGYKYSEDKIEEIAYVISENEKHLTSFSKKILLDYINSNCNTNFDIEFIDRLAIKQENCYYEDEKLVELIKYLKDKYDLYIITNWFTKTQIERLKHVGIYEYFKKVVGADENYFKPDKRMYNILENKYKMEDIISIGDDYIRDIKPALEMGMNVIWITNEKRDDIKTIKNIYELKDIL